MKRILALTLAVGLSGCAGLLKEVNNPIGRDQLYAVEAGYGLALSLAVGYRNLPLCAKNQAPTVYNICAKRSVIVQLQAADRKAQVALDRAKAFVDEYPTINAVGVIQVAADAVAAFQSLEASNNIR